MTATTSTPTTAAATPQPRFGDHALNVAVAAACFRAVRRSRPLPQAEAATVAVYVNRANLDLWLRAGSDGPR